MQISASIASQKIPACIRHKKGAVHLRTRAYDAKTKS
jgi:hypothetical protein